MKIKNPKAYKIGNIMPSNHNAGNVYDPEGISPTVMDNHGYPVFVIEKIKDNE